MFIVAFADSEIRNDDGSNMPEFNPGIYGIIIIIHACMHACIEDKPPQACMHVLICPTHANTVHSCVITVQDVVDIPVDDIHNYIIHDVVEFVRYNLIQPKHHPPPSVSFYTRFA